MLRLTLGLAAVLVFGDASADVANAQTPDSPSRTDEIERWVPSLGAFGGFLEQEANGTIMPGALEGPQCERIGIDCLIAQQIQPFAADDDHLRAFRGGLVFELMTPRIAEGLGRPRLFAHVDPIYVAGFDRRIAGSGNPGPMIEGELPPTARRSDEAAYAGQGTRLNAEISPFVIAAGLGVAFSFDVLDSRIRVKPSIEYMRERLSVKGQVNRVVQLAQLPAPQTPSDFRFISLRAVDRQNYDALGPGLEIEYDANQLGPFTVTPFAAARAYHFFGNLEVSLRDENEYGEFAEWRFDRDEWQWAAEVGVRFRWAPVR